MIFDTITYMIVLSGEIIQAKRMVIRMTETKERPLLVIHVECGEAYSVCGSTQDIVMIPFTGTANSPYFVGRVIGTGVDTQKIPKGGSAFLSARYMLEGEDFEGQKCRIFIENQGTELKHCTPSIVSKALSGLEGALLTASVEPDGSSVVIKIYKGKK